MFHAILARMHVEGEDWAFILKRLPTWPIALEREALVAGVAEAGNLRVGPL